MAIAVQTIVYTIVQRELFSENFLREVLAPDIAAAALPGHFVMLRLHENGERIALTVADFDRERGTERSLHRQGAHALGWPVSAESTAAAAIALVALGVWWSLRRPHHPVFR